MIEIKEMDSHGIEFLIGLEGLELKPYLDSVGIPTIGVGCTYYANGTRVKMTDPSISKDMAIQLFRTILKHYETAVWSSTRDDINQHQFNGLTCICFNIGVNAFKNSTLLKRVNDNPNDSVGITAAFMMWKKPSELIPRRKKEVKEYFS